MKFLTVSTLILLSFGIVSAQNDTISTASGLKYILTKTTKSPRPKDGNLVLVHYIGRLTDGKVFDSSVDRGEPFSFSLGRKQVIKGWDEGIALLRIGEKATLIIPSELGYGKKGAGKMIPPDATLIFDVELLGVKGMAIGQIIAKTLDEQGTNAAVKKYQKLFKQKSKNIYFAETELNMLGYSLLNKKRVDEAIAILKLNASSYPKSFNVYDSLAEAYMTKGEKNLAIKNYERSLALNPKNENATEMLKKLKE